MPSERRSNPVGICIPAVEPPTNGNAPRPTLRRGATGPFVSKLRTLLAFPSDGAFDGPMEASVRKFQREHDLVPDGIVGPKTWAKLDTLAAAGSHA
jgi:peptidoglycan hydrolase-like protein with peptidoglycan-binding domain